MQWWEANGPTEARGWAGAVSPPQPHCGQGTQGPLLSQCQEPVSVPSWGPYLPVPPCRQVGI